MESTSASAPASTNSSTERRAFSVDLICAPTISYAAVQNCVPLVHSIRLENISDTIFRNVELLISGSPAFMQGQKFLFDQILPGETRSLSVEHFDLKPDYSFFLSLNEAERGYIQARVVADCIDDQASHKIQVDILAHNEWGGTRGLPELLTAFCQPTSLVIDRLLGQASELLKSSDIRLQLDGYQSKNRERIWKQVSAIYSILSSQGIQYGMPPASFETSGQKIRGPEHILDSRVATCLDSALLLAACFEQAGLNAVILFKEAHAWVGVWLVDNYFPTTITDSAQSVRKRVDSGELLLIEATGITQGTRPSLQWARTTANAYLDEHNTTFAYAVDIKRCRQAFIRALPSKTKLQPDTGIAEVNTAEPRVEDMPSLPPLDPSVLPSTEIQTIDTPQGRLAKWKGKLLDLTLRNKLLNFKPGKKFLKLVCDNPNELEDILETPGEFRLFPRPELMENPDPRAAELFRNEHGVSPAEAHAREALARRELIFDSPSNDFDTQLTEIYRAGKSALEETGANTLYISIGMLYWKESPEAESVLQAPLILVPVCLKRGAVRAGIRLVRHDEETIFNPTLLQRLANDFEIYLPYVDGELPTDQLGKDVNKILQTVRMAVAELSGFEVRPDSYIGNFSFTKYVMWKDLDNRVAELARSPIVNHLINHKGQAFIDEAKTVQPHELDDLYTPNSLFTPLIADSSQLSVVCTAAEGKNIVVEGPPGTGKSQTITNMIAHFLANGKTVLFVAEKMAALDVVSKRLNDLGLSEFCLELHSAKAKKSEISKSIVQTLGFANSRLQSNWDNEAEKLAVLRNQLTELVKVLHRSHQNGLTIYESMGVCIGNKGTEPAKLHWIDPDTHDQKTLDNLRNLVSEMAALASQLGSMAGHPLSEIGQTQWIPSWQDQLTAQTELTLSAVRRMDRALGAFSNLAAADSKSLSLKGLNGLDRLADSLMKACEVPQESVVLAHQAPARNRLKLLISHGQKRNEVWDKFAVNYLPELKSLNAKQIRLQWQAAIQDWWPKSWFSKRNVTSVIKLYHKQGKRLEFDEFEQFLNTLESLNDEDSFIADNQHLGEESLGAVFRGSQTDWKVATDHLEWMESFAEAVSESCQSRIEELDDLRSRLKTLIIEQPEQFSAGSNYFMLSAELRDSYREFRSALHKLEELAKPRIPLVPIDLTPGVLTSLLSVLESWLRSKRELQPWCVWQLARSKAVAQGLQGLVDCVENGQVELKDLPRFFEFSYKNWWVKKVIDEEPLLSNFSGATHDQKIEKFKELDTNFQKLTQDYIIAKLRGKIPIEDEIKGELSNEIAFLRREAQKKQKHKSIRQILNGSRSILPRVKPCLLMSPLSVAQFIDTGYAPFDVVIFDEASQIPTWDAVGAIARGKQLICVGDPKQLPPTNFFNAQDSDGMPNEDGIEEMESILDECLSIGMPTCTLDWHYRSKNEGLITFSNIQYYDNRLVTFPSPATDDQSVRYVAINGIYDAGKSRTNKLEAEAIVKDIENHYLSEKGKSLSIGVITFNAMQQALIEKLIDARRMANQDLDRAIYASEAEPFFVKNLENVQGDERDIILFSITFGKDINGKISMNFGPMNKEGGHRRLNVAASRARHEVRIFSSLRPEHIDLSRTKSRGVSDLKAYLDFSLNGAKVLGSQALPTGREPDSPFEAAVIEAIRNRGWEVHPQVGVSGYRIDLAVVNPNSRGAYILGVECDGATYHSAASARDRDRLRQLVLEGLGWKIHRIWSTDWWLNSDIPIQKLLTRLDNLVMDKTAE